MVPGVSGVPKEADVRLHDPDAHSCDMHSGLPAKPDAWASHLFLTLTYYRQAWHQPLQEPDVPYHCG